MPISIYTVVPTYVNRPAQATRHYCSHDESSNIHLPQKNNLSRGEKGKTITKKASAPGGKRLFNPIFREKRTSKKAKLIRNMTGGFISFKDLKSNPLN